MLIPKKFVAAAAQLKLNHFNRAMERLQVISVSELFKYIVHKISRYSSNSRNGAPIHHVQTVRQKDRFQNLKELEII